MSQRNLARPVMLGFMAAIGFNSTQVRHARAQDAQVLNSAELQTVVVTAQKIRQNINDVGMSISVVSADQIAQNGISSPQDLSKLVPGLVYAPTQGGEATYTIRGVGFNDIAISAPPAIGMYVDQVPLPYSAMGRGAILDLERVEVLKGPQGTLFGENSSGGALNFIPNQPTRYFAAGGDVSYTSYNEALADGFVSGPISNTVKARVAFSADNGGAWQRSESRDATNGAKRLYIGRLLLDWQPIDPLKAQLNVNGWIDRSDELAPQALYLFYYPPGPPLAPATPPGLLSAYTRYVASGLVPPTGARQADWNPGVPYGSVDPINHVTHHGYGHDDNFVQSSARVDLELGGGTTLTSITSWERLFVSDLIDGDGLNINNTNISEAGTVNSLYQELRLSGKLKRLTWIVGGNYEDDRNHNGAAIFANDGTPVPPGQFFGAYSTTPGNSSGPVDLERVKTGAVFAHAEYGISERLRLVAGIRFSDVRIRNASCTYDGGDGVLAEFATAVADSPPYNNRIFIPPASCITLNSQTGLPGVATDHLDETNVPFNIGINWKVMANSLLYASITRGYKEGTFSSVGALFSNLLNPARQEELTDYETGAKLALHGGRLRLNGALFYYQYLNKQVLGTVQEDNAFLPLATATVNVPKSRIRGAELEAAWAPTSSWLFEAGATYLDSEITQSDALDNRTALNLPKDVTGEALPQTPKWEAQGDVQYNFPLAGELSGFVGAHGNYQSRSYSGLGEETLAEVDAYADLDLRLGVRSADMHWTGMFFVNNATNRYSWSWAGKPGNDLVFRFANPPRIFGVRVSYRP